MRIKQSPEDFRVFEDLRFDEDPHGAHHVHLVTKRKLSTLEAIDRIAREPSALDCCGDRMPAQFNRSQ